MEDGEAKLLRPCAVSQTIETYLGQFHLGTHSLTNVEETIFMNTLETTKPVNTSNARMSREEAIAFCEDLCDALMTESRTRVGFYFHETGRLFGWFEDDSTDEADSVIHFGDLTEPHLKALVHKVIAEAEYQVALAGWDSRQIVS